MLLTDEEIKEMLQIGRDSNVEVCLFVGPRSSWDIGSQTLSAAGKAIAPTHRGMVCGDTLPCYQCIDS